MLVGLGVCVCVWVWVWGLFGVHACLLPNVFLCAQARFFARKVAGALREKVGSQEWGTAVRQTLS